MSISIKNAQKASKLKSELETLLKGLGSLTKRLEDNETRTLVTIHVNPAIHIDLDSSDLVALIAIVNNKINFIKNKINELGFHLED